MLQNQLYSLTTLVTYLNERFKVKKSGKPFNVADVQQYIKIGHIPKYLGDIKIKKDPNFPMNLYKLIEKIKEDELGQ